MEFRHLILEFYYFYFDYFSLIFYHPLNCYFFMSSFEIVFCCCCNLVFSGMLSLSVAIFSMQECFLCFILPFSYNNFCVIWAWSFALIQVNVNLFFWNFKISGSIRSHGSEVQIALYKAFQYFGVHVVLKIQCLAFWNVPVLFPSLTCMKPMSVFSSQFDSTRREYVYGQFESLHFQLTWYWIGQNPSQVQLIFSN